MDFKVIISNIWVLDGQGQWYNSNSGNFDDIILIETEDRYAGSILIYYTIKLITNTY